MTARFWRISLRVVLALSLVGNAAAIGGLVRVGLLRDVVNGGSGGVRGLPADIRTALADGFNGSRPELRAMVTALGQARAEMFAAAEARDAVRLEAAMAEVRSRTTTLQTAAQALLLDAVTRPR